MWVPQLDQWSAFKTALKEKSGNNVLEPAPGAQKRLLLRAIYMQRDTETETTTVVTMSGTTTKILPDIIIGNDVPAVYLEFNPPKRLGVDEALIVDLSAGNGVTFGWDVLVID